MTIKELRAKSSALRKKVAALKKDGKFNEAERAHATALCAENIVRRRMGHKAAKLRPIKRPKKSSPDTQSYSNAEHVCFCGRKNCKWFCLTPSSSGYLPDGGHISQY